MPSRVPWIRREVFIRSCERLAAFRWKVILIEATYEEMKSNYRAQDENLLAGRHPDWIADQRPAFLKTGDYSIEDLWHTDGRMSAAHLARKKIAQRAR